MRRIIGAIAWRVTAASLCVSAGLAGQAVEGRILEDGSDRPLPSTVVVVLDSAGGELASGLSDAEGRFHVELPRAGLFRVRAEHVGHEPLEGMLRVGAGQTLLLDVLLAPRAIPVDPVVVADSARVPYLERTGFNERRASRSGHFLDRGDIEDRTPRLMTDLMYGVTGVRVVRAGPRGQLDVRMRGTARPTARGIEDCWPRILLDGVMARDGGRAFGTGAGPERTLDEIVVPTAVEALEIYRSPSEVPAAFSGTGAGCGLIVIWTRH